MDFCMVPHSFFTRVLIILQQDSRSEGGTPSRYLQVISTCPKNYIHDIPMYIYILQSTHVYMLYLHGWKTAKPQMRLSGNVKTRPYTRLPKSRAGGQGQ